MKIRYDNHDYPCQFLGVKGERVKVLILRNGKKLIISADPAGLIVSESDRVRFLGGVRGDRAMQEWDLIFLLKRVKNWPPAPPPIDLRALLSEECPYHLRGAR